MIESLEFLDASGYTRRCPRNRHAIKTDPTSSRVAGSGTELAPIVRLSIPKCPFVVVAPPLKPRWIDWIIRSEVIPKNRLGSPREPPAPSATSSVLRSPKVMKAE